MNKKLLLSLLVCLGITFLGFSQVSKNYKQLAKSGEANYYNMLSLAKEEFAAKDLKVLENKKALKQFNRWAYYWANRVNQDGTFPNENADYFNAGILDANGKIVPQNNNAFQRSSSSTWTNIGPEQTEIDNNGYSNYPQLGRLNAFLRIKHPTNTNQDVLFVGAPNGGIWKSTDGGANWAPKLDQVAGIGVTDIATVPGTTTANYTTQPIYVSTGDYDGANARSIGILKSTDGGENFSSTGLSYTINQQKTTGDLIVIDANTVFVGEEQIMKTVDGGTNWTTAYNNGFSGISVGRAARNGNEIMYTDNFRGIYYTSDYTNDSNWSLVITISSNNKAAVTVDNNGDFYIQAQDGQVRKFNKTNSTFSNIGNLPTGYNSQGGYNQALIVTNDIMITGEFNGQSSTDNGTNWTRSLNGYWNNASSPGTYIHSDHHRMGKLDGALEFWSVNDGGLSYINYSSATSTKPTITYKSGKVKVTQSYSVAINPAANDGATIIANQDNDGMSKKGSTWYAIALGDGIQSAINYNTPDTRYAAGQSGSLVQTTTGFQSELNGNGTSVTIPVDGQAVGSFYFPLEMHKTNPNTLYAGGKDDVYKIDATTAGLSIAPTSSGIGGNVRDVATHGNSVMASTNNAIRFSSDQGASWSTVTGTGISGGNITSVDYDATNNSIMYASVSGYTANQKVFKSTNGGANWTSISGDLPNIVVNEVILKQGQSNEYVFVATNLGVYYTNNGGTNWIKLGGQSLPNSDVRDIEIHYTGDKLVAATFGRGLWEIPIPNTTLGIDSPTRDDISVSVYPNPATTTINVKTPTLDYNYIIYNVVGGIVKKGSITNEPINISGLANNIYMLRVYNSENSITKKIIVN